MLDNRRLLFLQFIDDIWHMTLWSMIEDQAAGARPLSTIPLLIYVNAGPDNFIACIEPCCATRRFLKPLRIGRMHC